MGQSVVKNPRRIFSQTSSSSASSGGGGVSIPTVANYASLPDPTTVAGEFRWVSTATGVYLVGLYYSDGISWSASEANEIIVVANYSALPTANTASGQFYWCSAAQGTSWLPGSLGGTYYNSGMYYSNGTTWEWLNVPYNATQAEVHTGVDNTKFVTPSTFAGEKNVTDGIVSLTGFNHNFKNTAGTFLSYFTNSNTASRTYTFQDADGTVAFLSDISTKEPAITGTTNVDFWSGAKTFINFASTVRSSVLTGLSLATNQVIAATDSVLAALGYLQAQITAWPSAIQTLTNKTLTSPIISDMVGGSSTTQTISYKTTTGVGATGADHVFKSGNNGATEILRLLNNGNVAQLGYTGTALNGIYMNLSSPSNVTTKWIELVSNSRNTEKSALIFTTLEDNTSGSGKLVVSGIASGGLNGGSRIGIRIDGSENTSIYLTQNNAGSNQFGIEGGASVSQISVNKDFTPTGNNALYLGYSNRRWLHAYFNNLYPTLIQSSSTIDVTGYNYQYASLLPATGAVANQLIKTYFLSTDAGTSTSFVAGVFRVKNTVTPTAGAQKTHFAFDTNLNGTTAERMRIDGVGLAVFGLNTAFTPTALLHLGAESSAANTEPIRFTTPTNQTGTPVAGAFGVSTSGDNLNFVIATGAVRKTIVLADTNLTSGRVAIITTNGRLTNSSAPAADGVYASPTSITIANGIITAIS